MSDYIVEQASCLFFIQGAYSLSGRARMPTPQESIGSQDLKYEVL